MESKRQEEEGKEIIPFFSTGLENVIPFSFSRGWKNILDLRYTRLEPY